MSNKTDPCLDRLSVVECFVCDVCGQPHRARCNAVDCCKCITCGTKFDHRGHYGSECGSCSYGSQLREARKAVTRAEEQLASATRRRQELLRMKRPAKGSPVA